MKYANYSFRAKGVNNLGDNMQIIAIHENYRSMGIDLKDVVYIPTDDLDSYSGEYVILPVTMPLIDYREGGIAGRFSERIIPVFLGFTMVKDSLEPGEVAYFKRFEPIGCRDERTLHTLRRYHIDCYLHGCITVTLPRRPCAHQADKVFIVDVDESLLGLIPDHLKQNAEYRTHLIKQRLENPKDAAIHQYQEYKDQAKLVITSLLHCAVPCAAAGIPVIMISTGVSYRMAWLEKLLPIYTPDRVDSVNWDPKPLEMEEHKEHVLSLTARRLRAAFEKYNEILDLSFFYEERSKSEYVNDAIFSLQQFIAENWTDLEATYQYSVWGMTQSAELLVDYISARYPNARLCHAYDAFRQVHFRGLISEHPNAIENYPDETVFVTTPGAEKAARELFERLKRPAGTFSIIHVKR